MPRHHPWKSPPGARGTPRSARASALLAGLLVALVGMIGAALPAGAGAPIEPSPYITRADQSAELAVGADNALWSVESENPTALRRTLANGERSSVPLPGGGVVNDLAPGVGGDAVWVSVFDKVHRVTAAGVVTTVTMPDGIALAHLEPSRDGQRMYYSARVLDANFATTGWVAGAIDATGDVTYKASSTALDGELVAGPDGTYWTTGLVRINADLTTTAIQRPGDRVTGAVLGADGLLWVSYVTAERPAVARLRADGSVVSTTALPGPVVAGGGIAPGPDGAVYIATERGYLRVTADGQIRPVLKRGETQDHITLIPGESVLFAGDIFYVAEYNPSGRLDLDGRSVPLVIARTEGPVTSGGTVTVSIEVTGAQGTPRGAVTVMDHRCCLRSQNRYEPAGSATLDAGGRARITYQVADTGVSDRFHVDYSGSSAYLGTTSLDIAYQAQNGSETERYIAQTYEDLLNRQPEPAGLQYWTGELGRGTPRTAVSYALAISSEHRERFVDALFRDYLNRAAERAGRDSFVADLSRGATMNQIRASILGSQEYYVRFGGGSVDGYITALYEEVLNRQPDAPGRTFWRNELARGVSKPTMASALLSSQEALRRLVDARFQQLLRRGVDTGGRDYWVSLLQRGFREERLIAELIGSDEYYRAAVAGRY